VRAGCVFFQGSYASRDRNKYAEKTLMCGGMGKMAGGAEPKAPYGNDSSSSGRSAPDARSLFAKTNYVLYDAPPIANI